MIPNMQTFFYKQTKNSKTTKNKSISYFFSECVFNGKKISDQTQVVVVVVVVTQPWWLGGRVLAS